MIKLTRETEGIAALAGAALVYSTFGIMARELGHMWSDEAQVAARFALAAVILTVIWFVRRRAKLPKRTRRIALLSGPLLLMTGLFFTYAIQHTTLANTIFLYYGGSVLTMFTLSSLWLRERVTKTKVAAVILSVAGIAIYADHVVALSIGVVTALVGGVFDGASGIIRKKYLVGYDKLTVLFYQFLTGAAAMVGIMFMAGGPFMRTVSFSSTVTLVVYVIAIIVLSQLLLVGFSYVDANVATVILAMGLVFTTIIGYTLFQEKPLGHELLGGGLILAATILSGLQAKKGSKNA